MTIFGFGGYGGRYDENLSSKIARFKDKHQKPENEYEQFLRYDVGVDPDTIPYSLEEAMEQANKLLRKYAAVKITLNGNSLMLNKASIDKDALTQETADWDILVKIHKALIEANKGKYSFIVTSDVITPLTIAKINTQPFSYPVGTLLRILNGATEHYVRVGSFQSDDELMSTDTFQPIPNPETYKVVEVIE